GSRVHGGSPGGPRPVWEKAVQRPLPAPRFLRGERGRDFPLPPGIRASAQRRIVPAARQTPDFYPKGRKLVDSGGWACATRTGQDVALRRRTGREVHVRGRVGGTFRAGGAERRRQNYSGGLSGL